MDKQIALAKKMPYQYMERKTLINQAIQASVWYIAVLWRGNHGQLKMMERKIQRFLWEGQKGAAHPRVNYKPLACDAKEGGIGLISH
jgi:hypothetical protein